MPQLSEPGMALKRPYEHQQTDRSADLLHSFLNGSFGRFADIWKSTQKHEESDFSTLINARPAI